VHTLLKKKKKKQFEYTRGKRLGILLRQYSRSGSRLDRMHWVLIAICVSGCTNAFAAWMQSKRKRKVSTTYMHVGNQRLFAQLTGAIRKERVKNDKAIVLRKDGVQSIVLVHELEETFRWLIQGQVVGSNLLVLQKSPNIRNNAFKKNTVHGHFITLSMCSNRRCPQPVRCWDS